MDHVELICKIKKCPEPYKDNFIQQFQHYEQLCQLQIFKPSEENEELVHQINFLNSVIFNYKDYLKRFSQQITNILNLYGSDLESKIRLLMCKTLLRIKSEDQNDLVYKILFSMFDLKDKLLRKSLIHMIVANIKNTNKKHYNNKVNTGVQNIMHKILQDTTSNENHYKILAIVTVIISLWRRNIWRDEKIVNILSHACFYDNYKVSYMTLCFFMGIVDLKSDLNIHEEDWFDEDNDDYEQKKVDAMMIIRQSRSITNPKISRTVKKKKSKVSKALKYLEVIEGKKKARELEKSVGDTSAIRLLHDPQSFADKLLKSLHSSKSKFEIKLIILQLLSRVISTHQLIIPHYFSFIQRYLRPHQEGAVKILASLAQACHPNMLCTEMISWCVKTIADNFISQHSAPEIAAVGINTIREILWRVPNVIDESLAQELVALCTGKSDKVLVLASKSLLQVLRVVNPEVLLPKDRSCSKYFKGQNIFNEENIFDDVLNEKSDDNQIDSDQEEIHFDVLTSRLLTNDEINQLRNRQKLNRAEKLSKTLGHGWKEQLGNVGDKKDQDALVTSEKVGFIAGLKRKDVNPDHLPESIKSDISKVKTSKDYVKKIYKDWRVNPTASKTENQRKKEKSFMMAKHKKQVTSKKTKSYREKLTSMKKSIKKAQKFKH